MGFFNNVVDEFGKKTGKAIGNKLYGSNADDIRIGGSIGSGSGGGANSEAQARAAEAAARKAELEAKLDFEREQIKELEVQNILNIEFDASDIESINKTLFALSAKIEAWIDKKDSPLCDAGLAKFKNGLEILQFTDPSNPSILLFQNKLEELKKKKRDASLKKILTIAIVILIPFILFLFLGGVIFLVDEFL